jgi:hypothetical protein
MLWVVFRRVTRETPSGAVVVCEQKEWELLEKAEPGVHVLVRAGISH